MVNSRKYHSFQLEICRCESNDIIYILSPDQLDDEKMTFLEEVSNEVNSNIIVVSGFDWDTCMTPWNGANPFKKSSPFNGKASEFLAEIENDLFFNLEHSKNLSKPNRYLIGISLSGLFALWSTAKKALFDGIASISGSVWFEGFKDWFLTREEIYCDRFYLSLGAGECKSRHKEIAEVRETTEAIAEHLRKLGKEVELVINEDSHFNNMEGKIADAVRALLPNKPAKPFNREEQETTEEQDKPGQ